MDGIIIIYPLTYEKQRSKEGKGEITSKDYCVLGGKMSCRIQKQHYIEAVLDAEQKELLGFTDAEKLKMEYPL